MLRIRSRINLFMTTASALMAFSACQDMGPVVAPEGSEPISNSNTELYSHTFSDGSGLQIVAGEGESIHFSVFTPIGSESEKRMREGLGNSTLADVYRTLDPNAAGVPSKVQEVSSLLAFRQSQAAVSSEVPEASDAKSLAKAANGADDWGAAHCRDFLEGTTFYRFMSGSFKWSGWAVTPSPDAKLQSDNVLIDRAYGWNMSPYTATMSLSASTWKPTMPPNSTMWVQWGGVYQDGFPRLALPSGKTGEIGITSHRAIRVKLIPFPK